MPPQDSDTQRLVRNVMPSASEVVELLDLPWEHARDTVTNGIRMRALGKLLRAAPPSVSRLCDRLQAAGFIERLPSPDSGREVTLRLTNSGRRHLQQIRAEREGKLTPAIEAMPLDDRLALVTGLGSVLEVVQDGVNRVPIGRSSRG